MSETAHGEDRELLLSLYLDGELEGDRLAFVEEKLRANPAWQADFEAFKDSEKSITKAVQTNWHDPEFTEKVMERVTRSNMNAAIPAWADNPELLIAPPAESKTKSLSDPRMKRLVFLAAVAALALFSVSVYMLFSHGRTSSPPPLAKLGSVSPDAVKFSEDFTRFAGVKPGDIPQTAFFSVKAETARVAWEDGTVLWLRRDAELVATGQREVFLRKGVMLVHVAKSHEPFTVQLPTGAAALALGTCFEVHAGDSQGQGASVRVLEGVVRRGESLEARGGEEISANLKVQPFDPREVLMDWADVLEPRKVPAAGLGAAFAAPWPQPGGAPGHGGQSPFAGPAGLAAKAFYDFPPTALGEEAGQYVSAAVGNEGRVFIPRRAVGNKTQLYVLDLLGAAPTWKPCGPVMAGHAQCPAVINAKGLVVAGTTANLVQAWDPHKGSVAWVKNVESSVWALAASYDGRVYCSTHQRLVALDGEGERVFKFEGSGLLDLQAPAGIAPDGSLLIVSRSGTGMWLTREGAIHKGPLDLNAAAEGVYLPPVWLKDGGFAVTTNGAAAGGGQMLRLDTEGRARTTHKGLGVWPLATGVFAAGNTLHFPDGKSVPLPVQGDICALAQDGQGQIYAAIKASVYRIAWNAKAGDPPREFAAVKNGEIVRGGIAIAPGRLIVTTREGVQVFE